MKRSRGGAGSPLFLFALAVLAAGIAIRLSFLGADPTYPFWSGWITDEGRWTELAREWALFGAPDPDTALARTHLILGPLFQALSAASFLVFGVGRVTARLVSVVFGVGVLLVAGLFLRRRIGSVPTLCTVALLAVQPDLVYFSRVAIPEMTALFFELSAFVLIVGAPRTVARAGWGGVASAAALGVKGTTAPLVPAFALIVLLVGEADDPGRRWSRLGAFLAGVAIPGIVVLVAYGVLTGSLAALVRGGGGVQDIATFLAVGSPYTIAATLYEGGWTVRVNLLLAVLWGVAAIVVVRGAPSSEARTVFVAALVWVVGWLLPWAVLLYFPERYVAHIHLPLLFALGAGWSLLRSAPDPGDDGPSPLDAGLRRWTGVRRTIVAGLLAVPVAAATGPMLTSTVSLFGPDLENFRFHVAAMALLGILTAAVLLGRWTASSFLTVVVFPPAVALGWWIGRFLNLVPVRYWAVEGPGTALVWAVLVAVAGTATAVLVRRSRERLLAPAVLAYGGLLGVGWIGAGAVRLAERTYVTEEIQAFLNARYESDRVIGAIEGTSVFLDTPFRYRDLVDDRSADVVVIYWRGDEDWLLTDEFRMVADVPLDMGPGYDHRLPEGERIRVFERAIPRRPERPRSVD